MLRSQLLQNLIENRIQLQQAEREKVVIEDLELAEALGDIMKKLKAKDEAEFESMIKTQGLTLEGVKKRLREQLMVQRVVRAQGRPAHLGHRAGDRPVPRARTARSSRPASRSGPGTSW